MTDSIGRDDGRNIWQELEAMEKLLKDAQAGHPVPMIATHWVDHQNAIHFAIKAAQDKLTALNQAFTNLHLP